MGGAQQIVHRTGRSHRSLATLGMTTAFTRNLHALQLDSRRAFYDRAMKKCLLILAAIAFAACQPAEGPKASSTIQINGAGATFPNPIYSKWFDEYGKAHPNVQINYQSIGSGGGIKQLSAQTVFFGASDGPMTDEQLSGATYRR